MSRPRPPGPAPAGPPVRPAAAALALLSLVLSMQPAPARQAAPGEVLVRWRASAARPAAGLDSLFQVLGLRSAAPLLETGRAAGRRAAPEPEAAALERWSLLRFDRGIPARELAERCAAVPAVEAAQPNHLRRTADFSTDDPLLDEQWGLEAVGWRARDPGSAEGVLIAVVDSGIDAGHPDLRGRIWRNPAEVLGDPGVDDDGNGYVDDAAGWDFTDAPGLPGSGDYLERDPDPADDSGHGTHVAGVAAAAAGNGEGIAGVAPGVRVMALRAGFVIEGSGYLQDDDIAAAIVYAARNGADVINLSLGDPAYSPLLDDVVRFALSRGVVVVAAAGNESSPEVFYPARLPGAIAVAAAGRDGGAAPFSNFGPSIDLAAPGVAIRSTRPGGGYGALSGTSVAAPHVSGAAALVLARHPGYTPLQVLGVLAAAARDVGPASGWDAATGHGLLQIPSGRTDPPLAVSFRAPAAHRPVRPPEVEVELEVAGPAGLELVVEWGAGDSPDRWRQVAARTWRGPADSTVPWPAADRPPGVYSLRATVRDGVRAHSSRLAVRLAPEGARVLDWMVERALKGPRWRDLVSWTTDRPSQGRLELTTAAGRLLMLPAPAGRVDQLLVLPPDLAPGSWDARIFTDGEAAQAQGRLVVRPGAVDRSNPLAGPALPGGYLMPRLSDFDGDGRGEVAAMLHGEAGTYASGVFFEWPQTAPVHSTSSRFIPWSHHDLDGDGRLELMAVDARRVRLFEQQGPGLFPGRRAWAVRDAWGGEAFDADADGRPEMFLRSATAELFRVFESRGDDDYAETAALVNDTPGANEFGARQVAADLDGDGRGDLLAGDSDGDLLVFEAGADDAYRRVWRSLEEEEFVDGRLVGGGADLDGDGDVEFIGGRLRRDPFDLEGRRWRLTVYGAAGDDDYGPEWQGQVLAGSSQGAGIAAADLDGDGELEWIAALAPHLYVFRADGSGGYEAVWHAPAGETWRPAAGDADGDGRIELFFNDPDGAIRGFSWTGDPARLGAPPGWAALSLGPDRVELVWEPVPGAALYEVSRDDSVVARVEAGESLRYAHVDSGLAAGRAYAYRVAAIDADGRRGDSSPARVVEPREGPVILDALVGDPRQVSVRFDQPMAPEAAEAHRWRLVPEVARPQTGLLDHGGRRLLLPFDRALPDSGTVLLEAAGVRSARGGLVGLRGPGTVSLRLGPVEPPARLVEAVLPDPSTIELRFDRPLSTVREAGAAVDRGRVAVAGIDLGEDGRTVRLALPPATPLRPRGRPWEVEVWGLRDGQGRPLRVRSLVRIEVDRLEEVRAWPNPFDPAAGELTLAGLPAEAEVRVFNAAGELVWQGREEDGDGGLSWTGRNRSGAPVAAGICLVRVEHEGRVRRLKIAVLRRRPEP